MSARPALPAGLAPRGLNRVEAAAYIGISPRKFDELVEDGRMPPAVQIDGRKVWDLRELDLAFDRLAGKAIPAGAPADQNEWDTVR